MSTENNKVIIQVGADTTDLDASIIESKNKLQSIGDTEISFASIKSFKQQLREAKEEALRLQAAGQMDTSAYTLAVRKIADLNDAQGELNANINAFNPDNKFSALSKIAFGASNAIQGVAGAMSVMGVESEGAMETMQRLQGIMAFTDALGSIDDMKDSFLAMLRVVGLTPAAMGGASMATKAFGLALKSIGIGLVVAAIAYLITNWDTLKTSIEKVIPGIGDVGKQFDKLKEIAMGVGNVLLQSVIAPIKAIALAAQGKFSEAIDAYKNGFNVIKNFDNGVLTYEETKRNEELAKQKEANEKKIEEEKRAAEKRRQEANAAAEKRRQEAKAHADKRAADAKAHADRLAQIRKEELAQIEKNSKEAEKVLADTDAEKRAFELKEIRENYKAKIDLAKKYGKDISDLVEAQKNEEADTNKKWDDKAIKDKDENAKKLKQEKIDKANDLVDSANADLINTRIANEITDADTPQSAYNKTMNILDAQLRAEDVAYETKKLAAEGRNGEMRQLEAEHNEKLHDIKKARAEADIALEDAVYQNKITTYQKVGEALQSLTALVGEDTVAGKALGIAQATINTYIAASEVLKNKADLTVVQKIISMTAVIAAGLANVRKIASVKVPSKKGGGEGGAPMPSIGSVANAVAPQIQAAPQAIQDVRVTNNSDTVVRAYISDKDLSDNEAKSNFLNNLNSL